MNSDCAPLRHPCPCNFTLCARLPGYFPFPGNVNQAVVIINNYFQYAGLQFFQCSEPKFIDDSNLANFFISQQKNLVAKSYVDGVINIYCVNTIEGGGVGG